MQNGTLEAPESRRTLIFDDEMREVLADEAEWFCASVGDNIQHAPTEKERRSSVVLREQEERLKLAIALCTVVDTGTLNVCDQVLYLPWIVGLVSDALTEYRDDLHHNGDGLRAFIIGGEETGHGFVGHDRAESIAEYHRQIASVKERIARCERFLELVES